jgi:proteasome activator subunit 4
VPVGKAGAWSPVQRHIPHEVAVAFDSRSSLTFSKVYGKSIVYLLTPGGSAQGHLETLVDLLEQFYHPSNGGSWTGSLERLLRCLFCYFLQRLDNEQRRSEKLGSELGPRERAMFVRTLMRLTERGQYSKNVGLANTVGFTSCFLAYVEPALMLPPIISAFQTALESVCFSHFSPLVQLLYISVL